MNTHFTFLLRLENSLWIRLHNYLTIFKDFFLISWLQLFFHRTPTYLVVMMERYFEYCNWYFVVSITQYGTLYLLYIIHLWIHHCLFSCDLFCAAISVIPEYTGDDNEKLLTASVWDLLALLLPCLRDRRTEKHRDVIVRAQVIPEQNVYLHLAFT